MENIILFVHVGGGIISIVTGYLALFSPKGKPVHRFAGKIFVAMMTLTALSAAMLGYLHDDIGDVFGGFMTVYFVLTAWMAAKRKDKEVGKFEVAAFLVAAILVGVNAYFAYLARSSASGTFLGFPPAQYYVGGVIMGLAAMLDLVNLLRGGVSGRYRIARHIWRICIGLFIAVGSFFLGQMQVFPDFLQKTEILAIPVVIVLFSMGFWLIRLLFTGWWRSSPSQPLKDNAGT
jgi:uncharacterized membrane protein